MRVIEHSLEFVDSLLDIANGSGGQSLAVIGDAKASGPYWAGSRFSPVKTLFEAVLRCVLSGPYSRIVAFTGSGSSHLPNWRLGASFRLGDQSMIWLVRGGVNRKSAQAPAKVLTPWEKTTPDLQPYATDTVNRLLWRSKGLSFWDRLQEYARHRDLEVRSSSGNRALLLVDYRFLVPSAEEAKALCNSYIDQALMNTIRTSMKTEVRNTGIDLILISEDGTALDFLHEKKSGESSAIQQAMAASMSEYEWQHLGPKMKAAIPHICLAQNVKVVEAPRMPSLLPGALLEGPESPKPALLYDMLRFSHINRSPLGVTPPRRSQEVALEFWANIDLAPLRAALEEEIIGQATAKSVILEMLEAHKERCGMLLARSPGARKTAADADFCLPAVGLFGAAGMGKTTMCKIIAKELFGDAQFGRLIDLGGKSLKIATIGVEPPMMGCDDESDLINFSRNTNGLGVVCFNEFTRMALPQNTTLANSLAPLLQILQDRCFEAANPKFRPTSRFYHLANTLFIFDGNVCPSGAPPPHGFHSIDELGPAFTRRVTMPVYFEALQEGDYREAARRAVARAARSWVKTYDPDVAGTSVLEIEVGEGLTDAIENRFKQVTQSMGEEPSIARLNTLAQVLPYSEAFDAARAQGSSVIVLDERLVPRQWRI